MVVSMTPLEHADVHHYHRPHLESELTQRSVCTVHHDLRDPDPWLRLEKFLPRYREARLVVCLNHGQKRFLRDRGISQTVVIPHGYNEEVLRAKVRSPCPGRKVSLGIISKYYDRRFKGEAYLHDLVKRLSPEVFQFVLVGERRLRTAEYLVALGYEVRLFESLPYKLFQSLYESIDYLLMCSTFEGGPANLSEAIATHTPIIATPVGFAPDFIEDGKTGLILSGDPMVDATRLMALQDRQGELARALDEGAPSIKAKCPTWKQVIAAHIEQYELIAREQL